ncbi:MAG: stage V sporulation protein AD [Clostridia bacterium]|nr:stage V sporulation protein AD [Clostridia bacterium]
MKRTVFFKNAPRIVGVSSVGGPKECAGCIGDRIEIKLSDDKFGEKSFEQAESKILYTAIKNAIHNAGRKEADVDVILAGDLLNQIISATFAARNFSTGYLGLYTACATFTQSILTGGALIDGGYVKNAVCATSSHFSSAERQYRYPLELGSTRPPQAQWTVTGAGALVISNKGKGPKVTGGTIGRVVDYGVTDVNNMGAAMAPAAADTLYTHFIESGKTPENYDMIVTGDLGALGSRLLKDLLWEKGYDVNKNHVDCGEIIYNISEKEFQGGSGAGCSSLVFCAYLYEKLLNKKIDKMLFAATGALLSSVSSGQGESIPAIAHAVSIEA